MATFLLISNAVNGFAQDQPPPSSAFVPVRVAQENPPQTRSFPTNPGIDTPASNSANLNSANSNTAGFNGTAPSILKFGDNSLRDQGQTSPAIVPIQPVITNGAVDQQLIRGNGLPNADANTMRSTMEPIRPVNYESPQLNPRVGTSTNDYSVNTNAPGSIEVVRELMRQFDLKNAPDPLSGQPLSLTDALRETPPTQRREMVVQYWETVAAWCRCRAAEAAVAELARLSRPVSAMDQALLTSAEQLARTRWKGCQISLLEQQVKLQNFLPASGQSQLLPLPSDLPLMQTYETQSGQYLGLRTSDAIVQQTHLLLPQLYDLILQRGQAVEVAGSGSQVVSQGLAAGQANSAQWLSAETLYQQSVMELIDSVIEYNQLIAKYSLTVAPASQTAEVAVAMLIVPERQMPAGGLDAGMRQASLLNSGGQPVTTGATQNFSAGPANNFVPGTPPAQPVSQPPVSGGFGGNSGSAFQPNPGGFSSQNPLPPATGTFSPGANRGQ